MYKMRHIATTDNNTFLTAEFTCKVYAWDLCDFKNISVFDTILDCYGLAISKDGNSCITAAYNRYGICKYDITTGKPIWHRKDIKKPYCITLNIDNSEIYASIDSKPMIILNSSDGSAIGKLNATKMIYLNAYTTHNLIQKNENTIMYDNKKIVSPTFAFLDACPTSSGFALSAVGNNLMFYDYLNVRKEWEVAPGYQEHFVKIGYSEKYDVVNAILYKYNNPRNQPYHIMYGIDSKTGEILYKFGLPYESCEFGFAKKGEILICSSGEIYELSFEIPRLIYKFCWD